MAYQRIHVVARLPYTSGLPRDVSINNWHFLVDDGVAGGVGANATQIPLNFYVSDLGAPNQPVGAYFSNLVSREVDACTLTCYDLDDALPRAPFYVRPMTLPAASSPFDLPAEVALCMSWRSAPVPGRSPESTRNRIYLGPLNASAIGGAGAAENGRPSGDLLDDIETAIAANLAAANPADVIWAQWSGTYNDMSPAAVFWVDDEFDTQRRRGRNATTRRIVLAP